MRRRENGRRALWGTRGFEAQRAERERALGLDIAPESEPVAAIAPEPAPVVEAAPVVEMPLPAPIPGLRAALWAWGEAHDWPRLPLARGAHGVYLWLCAGEAGWRAFMGNESAALHMAHAAIADEGE